MIKTYPNFLELVDDLESQMALSYLQGTYFKAEILKLPDHRFRLGVITDEQMEFDFDG